MVSVTQLMTNYKKKSILNGFDCQHIDKLKEVMNLKWFLWFTDWGPSCPRWPIGWKVWKRKQTIYIHFKWFRWHKPWNSQNKTFILNDFGYDEVFSKQLLGIGKKNDVLYAISTSGKSKSIINAIKVANSLGIKVISLTGKDISAMNELSDVTINTPSFETNHIQEMHIAIGQLICGIVENHFYGENE